MSEHTPNAEPVLSLDEVTALEQRLAANGTSLHELMDRAGCALAETVRKNVAPSASVVVLAGNGNNGGDGWVCARELARSGYRVTLFCARLPQDLHAEPARTTALETELAAAAETLPLTIETNPSADAVQQAISTANVVVDALLGTGFSGTTVREPFSTWISLANTARPATSFAVAADAPSGLSAQTGHAAQPTFRANATVTMLALKPGLIAGSARPFTGTVHVAPLVSEQEPPHGGDAPFNKLPTR